jgi:hypothetical protein
MSIYQISFDHDLYPGDLIALEFLKELQAQDGDITLGDTAAGGDFAEATNATISSMVSSAKSFWETGVAETVGGAPLTGLSATTPREFYDGFGSAGGGTGTWQYSNSPTNTQITGQNFAKALRGLFAEGGFTTLVSAVWNWLMAATSNTAFHTPASARNQSISQAQTGTYNPKLALTTSLLVTNQNATSLYDWATLGIMAAVQSNRDLTNFVIAKRQASTRQRLAYSGKDAQTLYSISIRGKTGLSFQVSFTETILGASRRVFDLTAAAIIGLAYRENPKIFSTKDHP